MARRVADWWAAHVPADLVPAWDFDAGLVGAPRDSSAAAVAASGLVELGAHRAEPAPGRALPPARRGHAALAGLAALPGPGIEVQLDPPARHRPPRARDHRHRADLRRLLLPRGAHPRAARLSERGFTAPSLRSRFSVTRRGFPRRSLTFRGGATSDQPGGTQGGGGGVRRRDLGGRTRPGGGRGPHRRPGAAAAQARQPGQADGLGRDPAARRERLPRPARAAAARASAAPPRSTRTSTGPSAAIPGRTIRVHAGDMVGASPMVSSYFHDEPSVRAMNLMDFDVGTLGNHEFDEGGDEMVRLLRGGQRSDGLQFKRDARGRRGEHLRPGLRGRAASPTSPRTRSTARASCACPPPGSSSAPASGSASSG